MLGNETTTDLYCLLKIPIALVIVFCDSFLNVFNNKVILMAPGSRGNLPLERSLNSFFLCLLLLMTPNLLHLTR